MANEIIVPLDLEDKEELRRTLVQLISRLKDLETEVEKIKQIRKINTN